MTTKTRGIVPFLFQGRPYYVEAGAPDRLSREKLGAVAAYEIHSPAGQVVWGYILPSGAFGHAPRESLVTAAQRAWARFSAHPTKRTGRSPRSRIRRAKPARTRARKPR